MENTSKNINLEQIFGDAEERFRKGLNLLADWSEQARNVVQERPGVLAASLAIAGFMTGLIVRKGGVDFARKGADQTTPTDVFADPIVLFITGTIAGFAFGPKMMESAMRGQYERGEGHNVQPIERH